jgi:CheY-like chemotaxis protein
MKRIYNPVKTKTTLKSDDATLDVVQPHVNRTLAFPDQPGSLERLGAIPLFSVPETLAKLRASHQMFARTEEDDLRRTHLSEMHLQVHSLAGCAGPIGFRKIAQMTSALEALLIELQAKPTKITPSVMRTVAQAIDTLAALFDRTANPQPEVLTPPKILVVDDEIISRETICSALGRVNLTATGIDDPLAAQRLLEQESFDLIFLDVEMPGQNGLDLCVNIREMATNRATPVVFVTAHSDFGSRAQSTLSGGNDFIAKPFLLVELAVKALTWLFKESPQPLSMAGAQNGPAAAARNHESQPAETVP